jgi:hypothetical protein
LKIKEIIKLVENKEIEELLKTFFNIEYHYNEIKKGIETKLMGNYENGKFDDWKKFNLDNCKCAFSKFYSYSQKIKNNDTVTITIVKKK